MLLSRSDQREYPSPHLLIGISAICLISLILAGMTQYTGVLEFAELKLRTRIWLPRPRISPKIVVVEIDNKTTSENRIGPLPWTISTYNPLIWSINQAKPKGIGLFIWFNREWPDDFLISGKNLFVIRPYNTTEEWGKNEIVKVASWRNIPAALDNAEIKSFSHVVLSVEDGLRRKAQVVVKEKYSKRYRYSLELLIACREFGFHPSELRLKSGFWHEKYLYHKKLRIPIDRQGRMLINFAGNMEELSKISFVEALDLYESDQKAFEEFFRDKIVLVGITTDETSRSPTPIGRLTAIGMRANVLNTLITKNFITRLDGRVNLIAITIACMLTGLSSVVIYRIQRSPLWILIFGFLLLLIYLILSVAFFYIWLIWLDMVVPILTIFFCSLFVTLYSGYVNLRILYHRLQETQDQLVQSEKEAAIGMMSAHVRHEIRNSLNAIRSPAELVRNNFQKGDPLRFGEEPQDLVNEMDSIIQQITRLDEMVENELSYFQNTNFVYRKHDLSQIISDAIKMNNDEIANNNVDVSTVIPSDLPLIDVDADKMLVAFGNLIKNACQAMPGGGKLTVELNFETDSDHISVIFQDTGVGISKEKIDSIFEPFHTSKPRGLGLGLTNVKNIIQGHQGEINVESYKGKGTLFRITLPVEVESES